MIRRLRGGSRVAVVAAIGLALTVAGCSSGDGGGGSKDDQNGSQADKFSEGYVGVSGDAGDPTEGGTLELSEYSETRSLDPTKTIANGFAGGTPLAAVYDLLVWYNQPDDTFEPRLAKSIESNDDHTEWTLTLRDGVTFTDGSPLDAKAVLGSIGYYMKNRGSDAGLLAAFIEGMEPVDDHTVVFKLKKSWTTFPYMLARGAGLVMAPAAYSGGEFKPIGAGPFVFKSYAPAESLVLTANKDYWNGAPHLDELKFTWLESDPARLDVLNSGDTNVVLLREGPQVWEAAAKFPGYMNLARLGDLVLVNNREGHPGADPRVRQALSLALDPEVVYQRAYEGKGIPLKKIFGPSSKWFDEDVKAVTPDVEKARQLLDEAKADGYDGSISFVTGAGPVNRAEALAIQAMLEQAGFTVKIEYLRTIADRTERLYVSHDFDLGRGGAAVTDLSPFEGLYSAFSSQSFLNANGYASKEMDDLLGKLQAAAKDDERASVLADIERRFVEDVPALGIGTKPAYYAWGEDVHGVKVSAEQLLLLDEAWVG